MFLSFIRIYSVVFTWTRRHLRILSLLNIEILKMKKHFHPFISVAFVIISTNIAVIESVGIIAPFLQKRKLLFELTI